MTRALKDAIDEVATLPKVDQENIGRGLLSHIEKLRQLRVEINKGIRSLDAGDGKKFDIKDFIRQSKRRYGKA